MPNRSPTELLRLRGFGGPDSSLPGSSRKGRRNARHSRPQIFLDDETGTCTIASAQVASTDAWLEAWLALLPAGPQRTRKTRLRLMQTGPNSGEGEARCSKIRAVWTKPSALGTLTGGMDAVGRGTNTRFLDDGRLCMSNNAAERQLRGCRRGQKKLDLRRVRRGRPARGGDLTLIASAKLSDIDPQPWLADVLARLSDHPAKRIHELLPWNWTLRPQAAAA